MRTRKLSEHKYAKCGYYVDSVYTGKWGYISEEEHPEVLEFLEKHNFKKPIGMPLEAWDDVEEED